MLFREPRLLGVILDLSLKEIKKVRSELIKYISSFEEEDGLYLFNNEITDVIYKKGQQTANIANYETDGFRIDLNIALKQSLFVLAAEDNHLNRTEKMVILVTDHLVEENIYTINKFLLLNKNNDLECKLAIFNLGKKINIGDIDVEYQEISSLDQSHFINLFSEDL